MTEHVRHFMAESLSTWLFCTFSVVDALLTSNSNIYIIFIHSDMSICTIPPQISLFNYTLLTPEQLTKLLITIQMSLYGLTSDHMSLHTNFIEYTAWKLCLLGTFSLTVLSQSNSECNSSPFSGYFQCIEKTQPWTRPGHILALSFSHLKTPVGL